MHGEMSNISTGLWNKKARFKVGNKIGCKIVEKNTCKNVNIFSDPKCFS